MTIWLVGCGKKTTPAEPVTKPESEVAAKKQEPPKDDPKGPISAKPTPVEPTPAEKAAAEKATGMKKVADEAQANAFVNTLGMKFVPVPETEVQLSIWETQVKDYLVYAVANAGVDASWSNGGLGSLLSSRRSYGAPGIRDGGSVGFRCVLASE